MRLSAVMDQKRSANAACGPAQALVRPQIQPALAVEVVEVVEVVVAVVVAAAIRSRIRPAIWTASMQPKSESATALWTLFHSL